MAGPAGPTSLDGGVAAISCIPARTCPLRGFGGVTSSGIQRSTGLALATGSYFGGIGEPFRLHFLNDDDELIVEGTAEIGTHRGNDRFLLEVHGFTIEGDVSTGEGSDCTIAMDRVDAASITGTLSCDQHPTDFLVNGLMEPIDISGEFQARVNDRGGASPWWGVSYWAGFEGDVVGSWSCPIFGDMAGGWFTAVP